ncbi:uncharacterized protein [Spinacia oleracea]|uniref:Neprosin activation peptide domain-containing protein n=1 Tax=Spinacia oleracea TaxID=3562 RepID=A0A9R0JUD7_SPIOL|nr:uncharacterized protein LOC110787126 [Spinacia oleracea]
MELKYSMIFSILIFHLLLSPYTLSGGKEISKLNDEDVYEIDYRGPETHSHLPPPKRLKRNPYIHHKVVTKSKQRAANIITKMGK